MKKNTKISFLLILLLVSLFTSCKNLFNNIAEPNTETKTENGKKYVTISGSVNIEGAVPAEFADSLSSSINTNARAAGISNITPSEYSFHVHAENSSGETKEANVVSNNFTIDLSYGTWTLYAYAKNKNDEKIYLMSSSYTQVLNADSKILNHDFTLRPLTTGEGNIILQMTVPSQVKSVTTDWNDISISLSGTNCTLNTSTPVAAGAHIVKICFWDANNELLYATTQTINVFNGFATNVWINNGGDSDSLIKTDGTFVLTSTHINNFKMTTFYVDSKNGSDSNSGTWVKPLKTIQKALSKSNVSTINVKAGGSEEINSTIDLTKDLKIEVYTNNPGDGKGQYTLIRKDNSFKNSIININTGKNIYLSGIIIDGKEISCTSIGSGIYNSGTLTLNNCEIRNNISTGNGAGVYNEGNLKVNNTKFYNNITTGGNGAGIYFDSTGSLTICGSSYFDDKSIIYVEDGKSINIEGNLFPINETGKSVTTTAYIELETFTVDTTVVIKSDCNLDNNTVSKFKIINDGGKYGIQKKGNSNNEGIIVMIGAGVSPDYTPKTYKISINKTYKKPDVSETVTLAVSDSNNNVLSSDSYTSVLKLYQNEDVVLSSSTKITVPSWLPEGTYTIKAEVLIDGIKYDREFVFVVARILPIGNESDFSKYIDFPDIYLTDDVVFSTILESVSLKNGDETSHNRSIITKVDNATKNIYGNGTALVRNTDNNKKITLQDANNVFLYGTNNSHIEINNIDFTANGTLSENNLDGIIARAEAGSEIVLNYCTFRDFIYSTTKGYHIHGGVFVSESGGKIIFNQCKISDFKIYNSGGCGGKPLIVYKDSYGEIYDCEFKDIGQSNINNSFIVNKGDLKLYRTTFTNIKAQEGGALHNEGTLYAEECKFMGGRQTHVSSWTRNCAAGAKVSSASIKAEFVKCVFDDNQTAYDSYCNPNGGAGIVVCGRTTIFDSCTFTNNIASSSSKSYGGGILIWNGENASDAVLDVTFKDNGSIVSVQEYITKYMSGNTVSGQTGHGDNIYLYYEQTDHGTVKINGTEYTASYYWE